MQIGVMILRPFIVVLAALLGACANGPQPADVTARDVPAFDREASDTLLAQGRQVAATDPAAAAPLYREAGLRWPDNLEAWERLAELERSRGNLAEAEAAQFMIDRLRLYPSEELYVQRQVNAALRTYLEDQRTLPGHNEATQTYGVQLASYYDSLLAERPAYAPPDGIFNLAPHEIPTALITGGAGFFYFRSLGGG